MERSKGESEMAKQSAAVIQNRFKGYGGSDAFFSFERKPHAKSAIIPTGKIEKVWKASLWRGFKFG